MRKQALLTAFAATILPFMLVLIVQWPLCHWAMLSDFFRRLEPVWALLLLSIIFLLPGFALLFFLKVTRKQHLFLLGSFVALQIICLPLVWILGFYTSRIFFADCI